MPPALGNLPCMVSGRRAPARETMDRFFDAFARWLGEDTPRTKTTELAARLPNEPNRTHC